MKKACTLALVALCAVVTTACSGVLTSDQPARQDYLLKPLSLPSAKAVVTAPGLSLSVRAVPGLDSNRILVLGPDARLSSYAGAHWPDNLPEVLGSVLQRSLSASGRYSSVTSERSLPLADRMAVLEIEEFYGLQSASGTTSSVSAVLAGSVRCNDERHTLRLRASEPVADERLAAIVAAHQAALDEVTRQLLEQLENACQ